MEQQTAEALKHIADKLDVPVQQLWGGLVAYAPFVFYQYVAIVTVCLVVGGVCIAVCVKLYDPKHESFPCFTAGMAGFMALMFACAWGTFEFGNAMAAKYAPEAWAARHIMRMAERR